MKLCKIPFCQQQVELTSDKTVPSKPVIVHHPKETRYAFHGYPVDPKPEGLCYFHARKTVAELETLLKNEKVYFNDPELAMKFATRRTNSILGWDEKNSIFVVLDGINGMKNIEQLVFCTQPGVPPTALSPAGELLIEKLWYS